MSKLSKGLLWLFPAFALAISVWLLYGYFGRRGPTIQITFDEGSGIQPEKTRIRYRGVTIGIVKNVELSSDTKDVIVTVNLQHDARQFAVEGSRFWVVLPKVNIQGVSGLETFFEGTYIAALPGKLNGPMSRSFKGKTSSEVMDSLEDTTAYYLESPTGDSINPGDPVQFRGMAVGSVTKVTLNKDGQIVVVQINVQNRYVRLIRSNTLFWKKTGIQADLGLFKSEIKISSLESLWRGGIEFFTPDNPGEIVKSHSRFTLLESPPKDWHKWNPKLDQTVK
jgi:paraquat-inducible protein B